MDRDVVNDMLGMSEEEVAREAAAFESGTWDRSEYGMPGVGRPTIFGEAMKPVTFKETPTVIAAIDDRASALGISRSDYLRTLVAKDLASA